MKTHPLLAIGFFFLLCSTTTSKAAEVTLDAVAPIIALRGEISAGDLRKVNTLYEQVAAKSKNPRVALVIESPGGDLGEAMAIGRFVRRKDLTVMAGSCFSACVYILAAGNRKIVVARIGIHRPFFTKTPNQPMEAAMRKAISDSTAYFTEMNIPPQLVDAMFSIPPEKMQVLTEDLLTYFRLNQTDMVDQEKTDLGHAELLGISRQEYVRRSQLLDRELDLCVQAAQTLKKTPEESADADFLLDCMRKARKKVGLDAPEKRNAKQ